MCMGRYTSMVVGAAKLHKDHYSLFAAMGTVCVAKQRYGNSIPRKHVHIVQYLSIANVHPVHRQPRTDFVGSASLGEEIWTGYCP